ncbi:MAG: CHAT domain-containing protein [Candidatus Eisenbacteria bacterium]
MKGDTSGALGMALRSSRLRAEQLRLTSAGLSERQALAYAAAGPTGLDVALSLIAYPGASGTPASVRQTWDAVVQTRTLVLDEMTSRHHATLENTTRGGMASVEGTLRQARQRLANLLVRGPGGDPPERYQALVRRARLEMERAERDIGAQSDELQHERSMSRRGLQEVFDAMPAGWGLVAYVSCVVNGSRRYLAFVRGAEGEPTAIPLGDADRVDMLVRRWVVEVLSDPSDSGQSARSAEARSRNTGRALRTLLWEPLQGALGNVSGVVIVPDGTLHGVNFGALPRGGEGYLIEENFLIHYITSELDIVEKRDRGRRGSGLLAFGGVDFGSEPEPRKEVRQGANAADAAAGDCAGFYEAKFSPLPQSRLEVEEIAGEWGGSSRATVVTGTEATEAAFKRLAPGKQVLHLATHGFFLDAGRCSQGGLGSRGIAGLESPVRPRRRSAFHQQSPLLLSGLALAAANRRSEATPHEEDGVLTAEEVASLDLRGVDLAVLSACDTGVAGASGGEGILGLRRAFQTAGVATLITSLWAVQDDAARDWMRAFYQSRIRDGAGTAEAVRTAMLKVLQSRRAQGRSTSPSFWASFLAAGDWN